MKKIVFILVAIVASIFLTRAALAAQPSDRGFNEFGYNYNAHNFVGTGQSWCDAYATKYGLTVPVDETTCNGWLGGSFAKDHLVMKWNAAWDACNANGYDDPDFCVGAWTDNEWNGLNGGSNAVWHYKIIWVGSLGTNSPYWRDGGYLIWGNYEVVMDQGTDKSGAYPDCTNEPNNGEHTFCTLAIPSGYGQY